MLDPSTGDEGQGAAGFFAGILRLEVVGIALASAVVKGHAAALGLVVIPIGLLLTARAFSSGQQTRICCVYFQAGDFCYYKRIFYFQSRIVSALKRVIAQGEGSSNGRNL